MEYSTTSFFSKVVKRAYRYLFFVFCFFGGAGKLRPLHPNPSKEEEKWKKLHFKDSLKAENSFNPIQSVDSTSLLPSLPRSFYFSLPPQLAFYSLPAEEEKKNKLNLQEPQKCVMKR